MSLRDRLLAAIDDAIVDEAKTRLLRFVGNAEGDQVPNVAAKVSVGMTRAIDDLLTARQAARNVILHAVDESL